RRNFARNALKIDIDYNLEDVEDTLALNSPNPTPRDFLGKFSYAKAGGELLEDMLANNIGWKVFSLRISDVFARCENSEEIELLPLPESVWQLNSVLADYRVLGVKRHIACADLERSEILWDRLPN